MFSVEVIAAVVLPSLVDTQPGFVNDVVVAAAGGTPIGDIGALQTLFNLTGAGYMLGGLIFGIALFRTGVLARWAAVLLAVSTVGTAALAVLPESFDRPFAVPEGIALIGLGISLWRDPASDRDRTATAAATRSSSPQSDDHRSRLDRRTIRPTRRAAGRPVSGLAGPGRAGRAVRHPARGRHRCGWSSSPAAPS